MSDEKTCGKDDRDVDLKVADDCSDVRCDSDDTISASVRNDSSIIVSLDCLSVLVRSECPPIRLDSDIMSSDWCPSVRVDSDIMSSDWCPSVRLDSDFISGDCDGCCNRSGERNGNDDGDDDEDDDVEVVSVSLGVMSVSFGVDQPLLPSLLLLIVLRCVPKYDLVMGVVPLLLVLLVVAAILSLPAAAPKKTLTATSSSLLGALFRGCELFGDRSSDESSRGRSKLLRLEIHSGIYSYCFTSGFLEVGIIIVAPGPSSEGGSILPLDWRMTTVGFGFFVCEICCVVKLK
jgi:hypothetical protein